MNKTKEEMIFRVGENVVNRAINALTDFVKQKYGNACVDTGSAFETYLHNSQLRYNKIKTLADLAEPSQLEGPNGVYVDVYVQYKDKKISLEKYENLISLNNNIVILGSGGTGKSVIMRHLFLNTIVRGDYVPVLVELRKAETMDNEQDLMSLICSSMEYFDVEINQDQFRYSLKSGKYIFLFDGLDEVKSSIRAKMAYQIQNLSAKYPQNNYILSSRNEGMTFNELETYLTVEACPLEKKQAVELILKLGKNNEKVKEFAQMLENSLYEKHSDFASNPLLLTMMYITFVDNNMIPEHLIDFYENAYGALYKRHDAIKEGVFEREYKSKCLGEREFKNLFSYFCFHTFFKQEYEFTEEEVCAYIKNGIARLEYGNLIKEPKDFFDDIKDIVCLMVEEGTKYKFSHRSFQTYFAAYYTMVNVSDSQQQAFFKAELDGMFMYPEDFYGMLYRLEGERFNKNILEPGVKEIIGRMDLAQDRRFELLSILAQQMVVFDNQVFITRNSPEHYEIPYTRNVLCVFNTLFGKKVGKERDSALQKRIVELIREVDSVREEIEIDEIKNLEPRIRQKLLDLVFEFVEIEKIDAQLVDWDMKMRQQDERMKKQEENNDLLSLL